MSKLMLTPLREYRRLYKANGWSDEDIEDLIDGLKHSTLYEACSHVTFLDNVCLTCENARIDYINVVEDNPSELPAGEKGRL